MWIAVDWGTTHLRAYRMDGRSVTDRAQSGQGMKSLSKRAFEPALLDLIAAWISGPTQVICCGMVGARQGWVEAPYRSVPCPPQAEGLIQAPIQDTRVTVSVIPGVKQATPADVMRGEETQIGGFLSLNPGWDGVICLPGTHTKWVHVSADEIVSFQTFMTGEMFQLLSEASVLRHSIAGEGWDEAAFSDALSSTISKPETLAARLFRLRADDLLTGTAKDSARATLSGLLLGAEIAAARPYWLGQNVAVIGADRVAQIYTSALAAQGVPVTRTEAEAATLSGLYAAYRSLKVPA